MKTKLKLIASLKIWMVIYPALTLFLYLFSEPLSVMPLYLRTLFLTISLVPLIVFAGLPLVDMIIGFLLSKKEARKIKPVKR
jgi:antibiotic biosynthesis monooxygenase (ABM) superfamily enzyme